MLSLFELGGNRHGSATTASLLTVRKSHSGPLFARR